MRLFHRFYSSGIVWGRCWGGGECGYAAEELGPFNTREELAEKAFLMLSDGSLDSGMGFESLIAAILKVTDETVLIEHGREFTNKEYSILEIQRGDEKLDARVREELEESVLCG